MKRAHFDARANIEQRGFKVPARNSHCVSYFLKPAMFFCCPTDQKF